MFGQDLVNTKEFTNKSHKDLTRHQSESGCKVGTWSAFTAAVESGCVLWLIGTGSLLG